jgi:hypothetical protein
VLLPQDLLSVATTGSAAVADVDIALLWHSSEVQVLM